MVPQNAVILLNSEYVVIVNTSSKENQSTGKIVFDENNNNTRIHLHTALFHYQSEISNHLHHNISDPSLLQLLL